MSPIWRLKEGCLEEFDTGVRIFQVKKGVKGSLFRWTCTAITQRHGAASVWRKPPAAWCSWSMR